MKITMLPAAGEKKLSLQVKNRGVEHSLSRFITMGSWDFENKPHFYKVAVAGCEFFKPPRSFQKSHFGENKPNLATLQETLLL